MFATHACRPGLRTAASLLFAGALLAGCGGGGGGGAPSNQAPVAAAQLQGEAVLFADTRLDSSGSADPDGAIASRSWDYGDGTSGSSDTHVYQKTGTFNAVLTVTDNMGATASKTVTVTVAQCSAAGTQASRLSPQPTVCIQTSLGEMVMELYPTQAPATTANFLAYVDSGFYAGTLIHRVLTGQLFQGGGYVPPLQPKAATRAAVPLESNNGLKNWQYTVAMARDPNVPDSATTQFYVNLIDDHAFDFNPALGTANGYAVFGQLISGTSVAETIGAVPTAAKNGLADVPVTDVVIRSAVRLK
jgi:peptidyl-prolyl cis-trans isomerase A (cyclophilin A)